jgi:RNA polymerase sigma-70 factor (ECF subfamily)
MIFIHAEPTWHRRPYSELVTQMMRMQNHFDWSERAESDLLEAARTGSSGALTELLRRSRPRMLRAAGTILRDAGDAEDAVQVACCKAFEHLGTFRGESSFNTWLTSIVVNQARMRRRELQRASILSLADVPESAYQRLRTAPHSAEEAYAGSELLRILHRELRRLPSPLRKVMLLYVESLPMIEIAGELGVSVAAAKARLFRARMCLQSRMRPYVESAAAA